jgi:hypothetical protein
MGPFKALGILPWQWHAMAISKEPQLTNSEAPRPLLSGILAVPQPRALVLSREFDGVAVATGSGCQTHHHQRPRSVAHIAQGCARHLSATDSSSTRRLIRLVSKSICKIVVTVVTHLASLENRQIRGWILPDQIL